jgi:hypothetical protein
MTKAARSPRKNACTSAILIDELDTGGLNSSVFPGLELDDQFVAVMLAHGGSTPEFLALRKSKSGRSYLFVSQKRRGRLSALRLCRLPKPHTWSATVLVDELPIYDCHRSRGYTPHPVIATFSVTDAYGRAPPRLRRSRQ